MHVVATAGHVDHGKSTLVQALTGMQPDRLDEERRRGLTIELGYAWTELDGVGEVAFVDVPGHERFLSTALAGVGPVQVAMLVLAADDPWMPQAAEHLRVLSLLGVRDGVVVVSRADLADPAPTVEETRTRLAGTPLAQAPIVTVSARTGLGLDELRRTLEDVLSAAPEADADADVRLWVDRHFQVRGAGTVVTGTLPAGTIRRGDTLADLDGRPVRVRGLEALGRERDAVSGPARVALNLSGAAAESIGRGTALMTPEAFLASEVVDVMVDGRERVPQGLQLHLGSARVEAKVRPLSFPYLRLTLAEPLPLRAGDRGVLRDPGSRELWGARVLDPSPPTLRRRGAAALRAADLSTLDGSLRAYLEVHGATRRSLVRRLGLTGPPPPGTVETDAWLVPDVSRLQAELIELAEAKPSLAEAARRLGLPDPVIVEALMTDPLKYIGGRIRRSDRVPSERALAAARWLEAHLAESPYAAPTADELRDAGIDAAVAAELHAEGLALRVAPGVLLSPGAADAALSVLAGLPQPFTASEARTALGTSRRVVLPLLAMLDSTGRTVRLPDDTRRVVQRA